MVRPIRIPIRQLRDACPRGCPSVRSSAYERLDRIEDSFTVAAVSTPIPWSCMFSTIRITDERRKRIFQVTEATAITGLTRRNKETKTPTEGRAVRAAGGWRSQPCCGGEKPGPAQLKRLGLL